MPTTVPNTPPEPSASQRLFAWVLLFGVLAFGVLAAPFFAGKVYTSDDLGEFHLPVRDFYSQQLAAGEAFDWHPGLYGGFYLTGEGQLGGYHPWHWLLYRTLPVGAALDVELLASYPLMVVGMFMLLRRRLRNSAAALFGGLMLALSGFSLLHFVHPNAIAVVAHIPWLLWAIDIACGPATRRQQAAALGLIAILTGSQLLLGYPQYVWFSLLCEAAYAGWRLSGSRHALRSGAYLVAAKLCGLLIGCVQLLPTMDALRSSTRTVVDAEFATWGSLHPLNLVQLIAPYLFESRVVGQNTHELGLYDGVVPLVLCVWLLTQRSQWGRLRPLVWAAVALGVTGLLLAFGQHTPLYKLQSWLPLVNHFRFPCRAIVLVHLSMACGAAVALAILVRGQANGERPRVFTAMRLPWLLVGLSVLLAAIGPIVWSNYASAPLLVWTGPLLMAAAVGLLMLALRGSRGALVALVLLAVVDQGVYGLSYSVYGRTSDLRDFVTTTPTLPPQAVARIAGDLTKPGERTLRTGNRMLMAGVQRIDGYAGLEPSKQLDYRSAKTLREAGVSLVRRSEANDQIAGLKPFSAEWLEVPNPAQRARLEPLGKLSDRSAADNVPGLEGSTAGDCRIVRDRPGDIEVAVTSPAKQLLVLTESFHDGWQAVVDGRPVAVVQVEGDFLGVPVERGKAVVELEFRPRSLRTGIILSGCGVGLMLCLCLVRYRSAR